MQEIVPFLPKSQCSLLFRHMGMTLVFSTYTTTSVSCQKKTKKKQFSCLVGISSPGSVCLGRKIQNHWEEINTNKCSWFVFCAFVCPTHSSPQCAKLSIYIWVWLFLSAKTTGKGNVKSSESLKNIGLSKNVCKNGNIQFILTFSNFNIQADCLFFSWYCVLLLHLFSLTHFSERKLCYHLLTLFDCHDCLSSMEHKNNYL